jgi:hypothetical protein
MAFGGRFDVTGLIPADQYGPPLITYPEATINKGITEEISIAESLQHK